MQPIKKGLIRSLDVIAYEEMGLNSTEDLTAVDMILRKVRNCEAPFGGVLFYGTGDPDQLPPVSGLEVIFDIFCDYHCQGLHGKYAIPLF